MAKFFFDKVRMTTASTGTGTITLSSAFDGSFFSLAEAMTAQGAVDGDTTDFIVEEGGDEMIIRDGVIGGSGTTVTRANIESSKIGGVAGTSNMTLAGTAQVRFFPSAGSLNTMRTNVAAKLDKSGGTMTGTLVLAADPTSALHAATKQYADNLIAAADALVWKGTIDCSINPNYPTANAGWTYRVSVAGKIGGASGVNVEAGDLLICNVDSTATGNQATVGSAWSVVQTNIDGFATAVADQTHAATSKATPVDADEIPIVDSAASNVLKKLTWANLKATLKATTAQFLANVSGLFLTTDQVWAAGATLAATSQADATVTMTIASPGVVTDTAHGMTGNEPFHFTTTGALPTGVTANTEYYVLAAGLTTNTYQFAATRGGTAIVTTGSQSGTHTRVRRVLLDGSLSSNFTLTAVRNFTLAKPYNWKAGQSGRFTVTQDGTGSRTMTYGNQVAGGWGVAGGTAIALSTAASAKDKIFIDAESSTDVILAAALAIA